MLTLTFLGGAETVTGSKHLLSFNDTRILIDCGLFQGMKNLREQNWQPLPVDARDIDAVILTHGHLDHCGYLPRLVRDGFRGPVFASAATRDMVALTLRDSARLQMHDAELANRQGFTRHAPALPLYDLQAAELAISKMTATTLHRPVALPGEAHLTLRRAGHVVGACSATLEIHGTRITFSGDLGRYNDPLMHDPEPVSQAHYLVLESTYGNRRHDTSNPLDLLQTLIARTVKRGGTVVIPSFAVGRTQTLIYYLWRVRQMGHFTDVPVYLDSPMAGEASKLLYDHPDEIRLSSDEYQEACSFVRYVSSVRESMELAADRDAKIILSASGMATGGRILHHLTTFAPDPRSTILLAGYQAEGTRGRQMLDGAPDIKIHGHWIPVRAEVAALPMLSAHADRDELMRWLGGFSEPVRHTFIVHGEPNASEALRIEIKRTLGWSASVPRQGQTVELC